MADAMRMGCVMTRFNSEAPVQLMALGLAKRAPLCMALLRSAKSKK